MSAMRLFTIIRFNITLLIFVKLVEFQKSSAVKGALNLFSYFPA